MATRINTVVAQWTAFTEVTAEGAVITNLASESVVKWGVPVNSLPSSLTLKGMMPPVRVANVGTSFRLLRIRYNRQPVTVTTGTYPKTVTCQAVITLAGETPTTITFRLKHTNASGKFTFDGSLGTQFSVAGRTFRVDGFEVAGQPVAVDFSANKSQSKDVYLVVTLIAEPTPATSPTSVFNPTLCTIPHVDPIEDLPLIEDCTIPLSVDPIIDCPEIDLPSVAGIGLQILFPEPGPPGQDGQDGRDGIDGCNPKITVSYDYYCVTDCTKVKVVIETIPVETCWTHFHYKFYLCCPYYYTYGSGCSVWVWCPCPGYVEGVDYTLPTVDTNCPKTATCTAAPGHWVSLGGPGVDPPCITGTYYGQAELVCDCPTSSSSSSTPYTDTTCCPDRTPKPTVLYLTTTNAGSCSTLAVTDLPLYITGETCWTAFMSGFSYSFCCVNIEGIWKYRLTVNRVETGYDCVFVAENAPESCDPFLWAANAREEKSDCCPSGTGPISLTFTISETA